MNRNDLQKLRQKSVEELRKEAAKLKQDIAKAVLDAKMNSQKNTNNVSSMKKRLAVTLTVVTEKVQEQ